MKTVSIAAHVVLFAGAIVFASCSVGAESQPTSPSAAPPLVGTIWSLVELNGKAIGETGHRSPNLLLAAAGGRASGFAACNQFSASYTLTGDSVRLSGIALTRRFCETTMDLEKQYIAALESAGTYRFAETRLELIADGKVVAAFEKR